MSTQNDYKHVSACLLVSGRGLCRRSIHALGVQRALVFMNFQQRLKDTGAVRYSAVQCVGQGGAVQGGAWPEGHGSGAVYVWGGGGAGRGGACVCECVALCPGTAADVLPPPRPAPAEGKLASRHMPVASLHGELTKQQRQATLAA